MLNAYILVSAALAAIFIILGFMVATRNIHSVVNQLFLVFSALIAGWLLTNYIGGSPDYGQSVALIANRLVFSFGILTITTLLFFVMNLIGRKSDNFWSVLLGLNLTFAFLGITPLIVNGVTLENDTYAISFGTLAAGYFLLLLIDFLILLFVTFNGRRHAEGQLKAQVNTILISLAITLGGVIVTNALVPFLFGYYGLASSGAFLTTVLVFGVAYSIVKHRLFDIRPFVARSAAYILLLATLSVIFGGVIFALGGIFLSSQPVSTGFKITYLLLALILAFVFQPLKRFFDKVTSTLFYRDAYNPQELLNDLNRSLVTTINLEEILARSSKIIGSAIKTKHCTFVVRQSQEEPLRLIGGPKDYFEEDAVAKVVSTVGRLSDKTVVTDSLEPKRHGLKESLQDANVAVIVRLQGRTAGKNQNPGYILLGQKRSGGIYSAQDIQVLEIIADELVIAIQNALRFEEIQQFNVTLQQKIEEATLELRRVNHRLRELDKTKDEFISMASHQLRTPLTAVKGYLSMVLEGDAGKVTKAQKEYTQKAFDGAQKMVYLIADMLNVSRLQTGKFVIENKPTDLAELVRGEVAQLETTAAEHQIKLVYHKPGKVPLLNLDETKIRQVVMNFVDNAIYYTPAGGSVTVELESDDTEVRFKVTDTGLGVPVSVQHHLFSKFYRADNARKVRPDGTGLGLFMAKKVVTAQGGAIIFKSTEGKGSTFGFSFPRATTEVKDGKSPAASKAEHNLATSKTRE